ncbi:TadE family type IV pilus minor pilin [Streptomyces sp. N35]|uniref:TadE family type IV pilus minor pilin n=1 Tax=Streptomyces sp. N35 TaxID=2795730 RepID=UPI0027DBE902|nr:TadE family type IV pilus minor pilin [Streptomyces sp. N35]
MRGLGGAAGGRCGAPEAGRLRGASSRAGGDGGEAAPRRDAGFVSAEAACAMPALLLVGVALVWALMTAAAQLQCVDAARAGARAAARQESASATVRAAQQAAPDGAQVDVSREGDLVRVTVSATSPGPDALALSLRTSAVALAEETVGAEG